MLLSAGRGLRFRPVTDRIPKPLIPFLNVPLIDAHIASLAAAGVSEIGVNLHHLGDQIEGHLRDRAADSPKLHFFREPLLLGTAGALANAAGFLSARDFLVVNSDAAIFPDLAGLMARHRESGRAATLLVAENRDPDRYTPLQAEGDRITGFGGDTRRPLLFTGVSVQAPRLLSRIPPGERALVADLWGPLLKEGKEEIGWMLHEGPFADLGRPGDLLRASLETLARGGPFPAGAGVFDPEPRVLALDPTGQLAAESSVIGHSRVAPNARVRKSVVWSAAAIGAGAEISRCVVAGGAVPDGARYEDVLLWNAGGDPAVPYPLR
ncbi:MAG: NDP-sugar synthase [Thermoanaerobaculia bacterium]